MLDRILGHKRQRAKDTAVADRKIAVLEKATRDLEDRVARLEQQSSVFTLVRERELRDREQAS